MHRDRSLVLQSISVNVLARIDVGLNSPYVDSKRLVTGRSGTLHFRNEFKLGRLIAACSTRCRSKTFILSLNMPGASGREA